MNERTSDSVYYLINELCENLLKQETNSSLINTTSVRKLKSKSFEILLNKSKKYSADPTEEYDSFRELNIRLFSAKMSAKSNISELKKLEKFEEHLEYIVGEKYFSEENSQKVLQFMLCLENDTLDKDPLDQRQSETTLLIPGPFTLYANYKGNHHYPERVEYNLYSPPRFFKGVQSIKDSENPYLPRFIFDEKPKSKLLEIDNKFASKITSAPENLFTGLASKVWGDSLRINVGAFRLFKTPCKSDLSAVKQVSSNTQKIVATKTTKPLVKPSKEDRILSWNWENLDCVGIPIQKPHIGEANITMDLQAVYDESIGRVFVAKIVSKERFLHDLKSLTVGIQSDSFKHDDRIVFKMIKNITVADILPGTIENYVTDFLECGTCYKRLQIMIMKRNYKLMFEGFIFKALCSAVDEYLVTFRQFVFSVPSESFLEFYGRMKNMMKQISNLSFTLAIHPNVDANVKPAMGSQFLVYLYREIMRVTERDFIMLLVFILRRCCHVYFKYLQKWLFYGILDDLSNELFICFVDHYRQNTKYFYDKAYFVRKDSVPGFFQGYEDQVLQCGKYTMLLKAFKPNHPLFDLDYPSMSVCLSFEEVHNLKECCEKYSERARIICGKSVTIRDVFQNQWENKKNFRKMASEKSKANMEQWTQEQNAIAAAYAEQKKKRHEELTSHLQEVKNRKIAERRANIELQLKLLKDAQDMEDQRLIYDNVNLRKRIEYYTELKDMLDEQQNKKSLQFQLTSSNELNVKKAPDTPVSTVGTDFESCFGDDDSESVYAECISNEFVESFEKTELELKKVMQTAESPNDSETTGPPKSLLKMSASDYFNCNDIPSVVTSDVERNRAKVMDGGVMGECLNESTPQEVLMPTSKPLTDVQRNRIKVLYEEFGMGGSHKADINSNPIESTTPIELTDLQKNQKKMMHSDLFAEFNKDSFANRQHLNLDLSTERSRNRKKVLESEFHILTGISTEPILTPMSTTSDNIPAIIENELLPTKQRENEDEENANIMPLDVEIILPNLNELAEAPPTAQVTETPECGLNTAGILARDGFNFTQNNPHVYDPASDKQLNLATFEEQPITRAPYQRCEELLKSNFKCQPNSPYFRLNYGKTNTPTAEQIMELMQKQRNLNSLSVITLTEFLQKSISLPMSAHLDIINNEVMRIFLDDLDVLGHFKSLRNYFFLMDGEFGSIICDGIIGRLESGATPEKLLNYQTLHSILDRALGSSILGNDKNAENLSFIISDVPEKFDLHSPEVLSNLTLSYRIDWPLNLILNPETLDQYTNIFKYLIKVRRISWVLEESYQMLKEIVKKIGKQMLQSPQYIHVQQIRHKFYHFVHALKNHITSNALQASWKTFKDDLMTAMTIEDIYRKHTTYVKRILFLCMLNRRSVEFYNTIESIFKISLRFYGNLKSREWKLRPGDEHYTHSRYEKLVADEVAFEKFIKYTIYLGKKIVRHGYQEEIGEFIHLINYNQYYIVDE